VPDERAAVDPRDEPVDRLQLSATQVAGSSAAAVSAAVLCSFFGVAGTVIGTAVTSLVATTGSALYAYSLRRTRSRLRRLHQAGAASPPVTTVLMTARGQGRRLFRRIPWRIVLLGAANVFVFAIALITGLEGILGRSLPAEFGVAHGGNTKTSLGSLLGSHHHERHKSPTTPTPASTDTRSPTPAPGASTPATTPPSTASTPSTPPPRLPTVPPTLLPTSSGSTTP
jgi:hypothetical protein